TLGRQSTNDIVIPDPQVSRQHARILWQEGLWRIEAFSQASRVAPAGQTLEEGIIEDQSIVKLNHNSSFRFFYAQNTEQSTSAQLVGDQTLLRLPHFLPETPQTTNSPIIESEQERIERIVGAETTPIPPTEKPLADMLLEDSLTPLDKSVSDLSVLLPQVEKVAAGTAPDISAKPVPGATTEIASPTSVGLPSLQVMDHTTGSTKKYLLAQKLVNIGRAKDNEIVIDEALISAHHLQIAREEERWILIHPHPETQQTQNGLLYQGRKISGKKNWRKLLEQGDMFRIEDEQGNLITLTYNDGRGGPQVILPALKPLLLATDQITLGRLPDNDVVLNHPQVSAHHARLTREKGGYRLSDLNSSNHTYVNGIQQANVLLLPDDEMRIGPFRLVYTGQELRQYDESESIRIDALELRKESSQHVTLLDGISVSIPPRSFVALVGSSGAGKSTLLDALSGLRPAQQGVVLYNGQDYYQHLAAFRSQLGYVPQEDIIHRDLTVERALYYAAQLRLPGDFTPAQLEQRVTEVLEDVEMTARRELLIKKLSGGQRKRISIALELLAKPSVFFLDEPTSGLDPGLDRKMMLLLRKLADKGHTVLLVTHATNNINICDAVCFLAQGGRLAYFGPPEAAKTYFQQPDFAEIYNALEPTDEYPDVPAEAEKRFKQASAYQQYIAEPLARAVENVDAQTPRDRRQIRSTQRQNPWKQFLILSLRYLELLWNDKWNLLILLLQAPIIGIILFILVHSLNETTVFHQPIPFDKVGDSQRFLFIMSFAAMMFGCINAAREIIKEEHIFRRERAVNLGIMPYLLSKVLILSVLCLLQCIILLGMMNLATTFYSGIIMPEFAEFYITLALISIAGVMIGLTISALVRNNDQAMSFIPLLLIPQVIFSGSMFPLKNIPLQIFGALFSLRWAMASLGSILNLTSFDDNIIGTCANCRTYRHDPHYLLITWLALVIGIVVLGTIIGLVLKHKDVKRS
ncbi:MAG TPA: FHA domain-containing protein, partial [Ktedonobacteraceae bacterium]|nr:FHA domain-containing protein [Ktedonobacteraceae bacterium]